MSLIYLLSIREFENGFSVKQTWQAFPWSCLFSEKLSRPFKKQRVDTLFRRWWKPPSLWIKNLKLVLDFLRIFLELCSRVDFIGFLHNLLYALNTGYRKFLKTTENFIFVVLYKSIFRRYRACMLPAWSVCRLHLMV